MPLTNFDAVSKSFNTNRHDLFPTSYIPSFSPPFYTSLSDELFYPSAPPPQQQQQYKPQLSQQQNHDTQSYSEEESEIFEKDLPPEPKLENTRLRKRRCAYLWCKNKVFSVDWKGLTSRILTSSYLLRLFREPTLESIQRPNLQTPIIPLFVTPRNKKQKKLTLSTHHDSRLVRASYVPQLVDESLQTMGHRCVRRPGHGMFSHESLASIHRH